MSGQEKGEVTNVWEVITHGSQIVVKRDGIQVNEGEDSTFKTGQLYLTSRFGNFGTTQGAH